MSVLTPYQPLYLFLLLFFHFAGSIDQVEELAKLDWVQPRVLDLKQVAAMRNRIAGWSTRVSETTKMMEAKTPELFVQ